jgi:hypothetical protein
MTIRVEPHVFADHVRLVASGVFALEDALRLFEQVFALASKAGLDAALIDARGLGGPEPTLTERYTLAVRTAELQATYTPRIRLAVLGHEPMIHPERFGEIVATRRGAVLRVFTDEIQALDWLQGRR